MGEANMGKEKSLETLQAVINLEKISQKHPKKKVIIVLDSGRLLGNEKHFLFYLFQNIKKNERVYFVTSSTPNFQIVNDLGIEVILVAENKINKDEFLILLECSIVVTDSTVSYGNWRGSPLALAALHGAKWIQMWHGIPMKKIEFDNLPNEITETTFSDGYQLRTKSIHSFIGTTKNDKQMYEKSFGFMRYHDFGYPRNDCLRRQTSEIDLISTDKEALRILIENHNSGKRNFLYAPTFRDVQSQEWPNIEDLMKLASQVYDKGDALFIAFHPYDFSNYESVSKRIQHAYFVKPTSDIYPLLQHFDLVISDYSSLIFDLLHLPVAQVLFTHDLECYQAESRSIDFTIMSQPVGPIVDTVESLIECIYISNKAFDQTYTFTRRKLLKKRFRYRDSNSSKRILKYLRKLL